MQTRGTYKKSTEEPSQRVLRERDQAVAVRAVFPRRCRPKSR
jgi:hypothetical protein